MNLRRSIQTEMPDLQNHHIWSPLLWLKAFSPSFYLFPLFVSHSINNRLVNVICWLYSIKTPVFNLRKFSAICPNIFKQRSQKMPMQQMFNNCCMSIRFLFSAKNVYQTNLVWFQNYLHIQRIIPTDHLHTTL